jgi:general transcription factor 3C polypeptide 3 (transcription factor C subunit 4)
MLYVNQNYVEAIKVFQNIITLEPNVHVAWTTLATCYEELNYEDKAIQCEMVAAHLRPSAETWKELGARSRAAGKMQQAIHCYQGAISADPDDVDAIWDRAYLLRETGNHVKVRLCHRSLIMDEWTSYFIFS